jgi:hypothetical protein
MSVDASGPQPNPESPTRFDAIRATVVLAVAAAVGLMTGASTDWQVGATVFASLLGAFGGGTTKLKQ